MNIQESQELLAALVQGPAMPIRMVPDGAAEYDRRDQVSTMLRQAAALESIAASLAALAKRYGDFGTKTDEALGMWSVADELVSVEVKPATQRTQRTQPVSRQAPARSRPDPE